MVASWGFSPPTDETVFLNVHCKSLYSILFKVHKLGVLYAIYDTWCVSLVAE